MIGPIIVPAGTAANALVFGKTRELVYSHHRGETSLHPSSPSGRIWWRVIVSFVLSFQIFGSLRCHASCFPVPSSEEVPTCPRLLVPPWSKLHCPREWRLVLFLLSSNRIDNTCP